MTVEMIYFDGCPNVAAAREQLLRAFAAAGVPPHWQEWDRNDPRTPEHARGYGSPTILVDGRDVAGAAAAGDDAGACRVYLQTGGTFGGVPSIETIAAALRQAASRPPRAGWRGALAALPAIGAVALPKLTCPACWPAYTGVLSAMGIGFVNYTPYLLPMTAAFLLLSLIALGWKAARRRGYGPLGLGIVASAMVLVGKFAFDSDPAMYVGLAALVAASLWNAWPRARQAAGSCPACVPSKPVGEPS